MKVNELIDGMLLRPSRGWNLSITHKGLKIHKWHNSITHTTLVYIGSRREKRKSSNNLVLIREVLYDGKIWSITGASFKYFEPVEDCQ